jgi:4-aminobutyrate aminotransferase/(S)-3-amino-2-methylpropionate transaminase
MGPIVLARGRGANLWDVDDNRYVDLAAGFGSVLLGHAAEPITRAIVSQSERLTQGLGDLYASDVKVALLERLAAIHPSKGARVLLCQSGADAVTGALKTAMLATDRPGVLAFEGAYHGLGYGPLAACGFKESYRAPFARQLSPHVRFVPYPRVSADSSVVLEQVRRALADRSIGAVLVEPVLGRGGLVVPPDGFLESLSTMARAHGALVVADEIWTGLGRSGSLSRMVEIGVPFDVLCLGKGLGGSLPIAAVIATDEVMQAWAREGEVVHTSTHAGAPLACATALATLDELDRSRLCERSTTVGADLRTELRALTKTIECVVDVRGVGLMVGIELASGDLGLRVLRSLLDRGYIATSGGRGHEVVVLTPPLMISHTQLEGAARAIADASSIGAST